MTNLTSDQWAQLDVIEQMRADEKALEARLRRQLDRDMAGLRAQTDALILAAIENGIPKMRVSTALGTRDPYTVPNRLERARAARDSD